VRCSRECEGAARRASDHHASRKCEEEESGVRRVEMTESCVTEPSPLRSPSIVPWPPSLRIWSARAPSVPSARPSRR
jgi:hypothetical protein